MNRTNSNNLVRPIIRKLHAYVPGEQPKIRGLIKLNTNENPYPPSPRVLDAIKRASDGRLRLYPNPSAQPLREALARFHNCGVENIIVGNGSDDLLALATRAFVEPCNKVPPKRKIVAKGPRRNSFQSESTVQFFKPSYSLYPVLTSIHGARSNQVSLTREFEIPPLDELRRVSAWDHQAALTFITTPNAPSGRGYPTQDLDALCCEHRGVIVLDEAYADFASENAMDLALRYPNVLVSRTFSKSYSLCFLRVGYFVGHPALIAALDKIRDSYNVNGFGQIAALATLDNLAYYQKIFRTIKKSRTYLTGELERLGFSVCPSQTNFLLVRPPNQTAKSWMELLRKRKILVRWFDSPGMRNFLRITIGSESEIEALIRAAKIIARR